jgi:hypothetical protein
MAIRRVREGRTCPNFLVDVYNQVLYARSVVYFAALLATGIAFCMFRTRTTAGKKLLGLPYLLALLFFVMSVLLSFLYAVEY